MNQPSELLLPPEELIYRVTGLNDPDWFLQSGLQSVRDIESALASVGRTLSNHGCILDFGCGCGRIMLQLGDAIPLATVTGVDIDADAVAWLRLRVPNATVWVINELPPMPFAEATFDLVYCHSVFTHLDAHYQDQWLEELRRVTKPGGVLVVSFSGKKVLEKLEVQWIEANADPAPMRKQLEDDGILFVLHDEWMNGPFPEFYHTSFHTVEYVKEHWGGYFKILNHIPCGSLGYQDFVVMERTASIDHGAAADKLDDPSRHVIPMPPPDLRALVASREESYDNPTGRLIFPEIPPPLYASVFDFRSRCGRQARQLMQQTVRPLRYVGVDAHRGMVAWCQAHLSAIDSNFLFLPHNVANSGLAPNSAREATAPFPVGPGEFTLVNAHSVFTHLYPLQTEYYLREIERILTADGIARTTWFLFDRSGYPWLEKWQNCLFVNAEDPTDAVIYDWRWLLEAVLSAGLVVRLAVFPAIPGHQWQVFLEKRREGSVNNFPEAESAAGWLCGATASQHDRYLREIERQGSLKQNLESQVTTLKQNLESQVAALQSENLHLSCQIEELHNSWSWRSTRVVRKLAGFLTNRRSNSTSS